MYCSKCGNLLNDGDVFCSKCGTSQQQVPVTQTPNHNLISQGESDLRLLHISYLDRLRAAEYCCNTMNQKIINLDKHVSKLGLSYTYKEPEKKVATYNGSAEIIQCIIYSCLALFFFVVFGPPYEGILDTIFGGCIMVCVGICVLVVIIKFMEYSKESGDTTNKNELYTKEYEEACVVYENQLQNNKKRVERELREKDMLMKSRPNLVVELKKMEQTRTKLYNVNLIPKQFRDMYSIYYLYDFLSTSNETLGQALMHCDLDKIKSQLNILIKQNNEIYNQLVQLNTNMDAIYQQNNKLQQSVQNYFEKTNRSIAEQNQLQQMIHADNEALKSYARTDLYVKFLKN